MIRNLLLCAGILFFCSNSYSQELIPYRDGSKWGFSTTDKKIVIKPKYNDVGWFSEGMAAVKVGSKWGYINRDGKLVIPARYTVAKPFHKGYMPDSKKSGGDSIIFAGASLTNDGYEICITDKGIRMPQCPAIAESSVPNNKSLISGIQIQKTYSMPNSDGLFDKITDDYELQDNNETYYVAMKDNKFGVYNSKFEVVVPFVYDSITVNKQARVPYLQVTKGALKGILLTNGTIGIEPENSSISLVDDDDNDMDYVIIKKGGKTFVRDINNKPIINQGYNDIRYDKEGGFIITGDNGMEGYHFKDNTMIEPKYKSIKLSDDDNYLQVTTADGKTGYISKDGTEYFTN
ncbi:MAG: WG repeat-containing protein [Bacteroidetes bacterium]|nr:WG repeat-containing protein [Bacteroidota bacterium]